MAADRLNLLVVEEYEDNGETRNAYTQVGVAFATSKPDTFSIVIKPGISVTGRLLLAPVRKREDDGASASAPPRRSRARA